MVCPVTGSTGLWKLYANVRTKSAKRDLRRAAGVLNAGKKVAILAGHGALQATDELEQVAEKLAAPIVKALLGKAAVPQTIVLIPRVELAFWAPGHPRKPSRTVIPCL